MADEETTPILLVFVGSRIDSNGTGLDDYWLLVTPDEFESGIAPENKYRSYGKLAKKRIGGTPGTARRHVHNRSLEPPPRRTQDTRPCNASKNCEPNWKRNASATANCTRLIVLPTKLASLSRMKCWPETFWTNLRHSQNENSALALPEWPNCLRHDDGRGIDHPRCSTKSLSGTGKLPRCSLRLPA